MSKVNPFKVAVPDADLADLRARLEATRWVEDPANSGWRYGPPISFVRRLCAHWLHGFDWRALETRINRELQITTEIEGLTIHTIHRRSSRPDATPLILLHGWPSSFLEFLDMLEPLAEPPAGERAFHVVAPSLPGYGFSTTRPGVTPQRIASIFVELMERLGYSRFMIQGGNWGSLIGTEMARQRPERVTGLYLSTVSGSPPPDIDALPISDEERSWIADHFSYPHFGLLSQKPMSPSYALNDSPAGLAAWIGEKLHDWSDNPGADESALSLDQMVGTIALYWFTKTIGPSSMLYYEMVQDMAEERFVAVPTAIAVFPKSIVKLPRSWAARHYNIKRWNVFDRGGHLAAMEVPDLLTQELREFATSLTHA